MSSDLIKYSRGRRTSESDSLYGYSGGRRISSQEDIDSGRALSDLNRMPIAPAFRRNSEEWSGRVEAKARGGIGSGSDLKGEDKSKVSEDGKMFKLSDFASPTFDPHDFVESHLVNRKDCSKTNFSANMVLAALEDMQQELELLHAEMERVEDNAKGRLRQAVHTSWNTKSSLTFALDNCQDQLSDARKIIDDGDRELEAILKPLRVAGADKQALETAREAVMLMLEKTDGIDISRAAQLLSRLEFVMKEAVVRNDDQNKNDQAMQKAFDQVQLWSKDLEETTTEWFLRAVAEHRNGEDRQEVMAQCARASNALNGGEKLIEEYISSISFVKMPPTAIRVKSLALDPDAKSIVEEVHVVKQKILSTVEEQSKTINGVFPHPSVVIAALVQRLVDETLKQCVNKLLDEVDASAKRAESKTTASSSVAANELKGEELSKTAAAMRRRYLCAFAEVNTIIRQCAKELTETCRKKGASFVDVNSIAESILNHRREDYLQKENAYLDDQIQSIFSDVIELKNTKGSDAEEQYQRYRKSAAKVSSFYAMTDQAIRACLESLLRCQSVFGTEKAQDLLESLLTLFRKKFIWVAEIATNYAGHVLPVSSLDVDLEMWSLGPGPVGDYLMLLSSVIGSISSVDSFFRACSTDFRDDEDVVPFHLLNSASVARLREELRGCTVPLELGVERSLIQGMTAITARARMILSRDVNQSTGYNLQSDTVDMQSIFLFASNMQRKHVTPAGGGPQGADLLHREESISRQVGSKDYEILSSIDEGELSTVFSRCCAFLEQQISLIFTYLDGANLEFALANLAMLMRETVLEYWQSLEGPITPLGAILLMKDAAAVQNCFPLYSGELMILTDVGKLFIVPPEGIWSAIERTLLHRLDGTKLAALLAQRTDYQSAKLWRIGQVLERFSPEDRPSSNASDAKQKASASTGSNEASGAVGSAHGLLIGKGAARPRVEVAKKPGGSQKVPSPRLQSSVKSPRTVTKRPSAERPRLTVSTNLEAPRQSGLMSARGDSPKTGPSTPGSEPGRKTSARESPRTVSKSNSGGNSRGSMPPTMHKSPPGAVGSRSIPVASATPTANLPPTMKSSTSPPPPNTRPAVKSPTASPRTSVNPPTPSPRNSVNPPAAPSPRNSVNPPAASPRSSVNSPAAVPRNSVNPPAASPRTSVKSSRPAATAAGEKPSRLASRSKSELVLSTSPPETRQTSPKNVRPILPQDQRPTSPQNPRATSPQPLRTTSPQPLRTTSPQPLRTTSPQPRRQASTKNAQPAIKSPESTSVKSPRRLSRTSLEVEDRDNLSQVMLPPAVKSPRPTQRMLSPKRTLSSAGEMSSSRPTSPSSSQRPPL